jgi:AcrR family transcriptional regulator
MDQEQPEIELPRGIALAWGVAANPQRGPKRELSIERIVEAAVEIADADGIGAVSMSAVAASLGFTTMSLYRYVTAKDDLILLMQEAGIGLPPLTVADAATWREGLSAFSRETLVVYAAHPWLLDVPIRGIPNTPNNLAWLEAGLTALRDTPLDQQERISAFLLVTGHVRWQGLIERGYHERAAQSGLAPSENDLADAHILGTLVTEEEFPFLHAVIASGVFADEDDDSFGFGLARVLDGIERYMQERAAGETPTSPEPPAPTDGYPRDPAVKLARQARREAEGKLREAAKKEREAIGRAREREQREAETAARKAAKG